MGTDDSAKKQEETEEIPEKQMEQDVRNRIMKLRAEGKTYREIAKIERVSIAQISRILKQRPTIKTGDEAEASSSETDGKMASKLFKYFKNGKSLPDIVIEEKLPPETVRKYYEKWGELNYSHVDPKGLTLLWHIFDNCSYLNELTSLTLDGFMAIRETTTYRVFSSAFLHKYYGYKSSLKELLVRIIITSSEINMEAAHEMLEITQIDEKWRTLEEFYPNADIGYMEDLKRIWNHAYLR